MQVSTAGGALLTLGIIVFCVTVVEAEAVHPFAGSVTVTEYEPEAETELLAVVIPPPQS